MPNRDRRGPDGLGPLGLNCPVNPGKPARTVSPARPRRSAPVGPGRGRGINRLINRNRTK